MTCRAEIASVVSTLPACKVLLLINLILFAGALAVAVLGTIALRRAEMRRRAGDPYAQPFGDVPGRHLFRSWIPPR